MEFHTLKIMSQNSRLTGFMFGLVFNINWDGLSLVLATQGLLSLSGYTAIPERMVILGTMIPSPLWLTHVRKLVTAGGWDNESRSHCLDAPQVS